MLTGADDSLIKAWEVDTGMLLYSCRCHHGYIVKIDVTPDNSLIVSACTEGSIRLWRMSSGQCVKVLNHGSTDVLDVQFDMPSMSLVSIGKGDGQCKVWNLPYIFKDDDVSPLGFDIPMLHAYYRENGYNFENVEPITELEHKKRGKLVMIKIMDISPCGKLLVTGGEDGIARLWKFGENMEPTRASRPRVSSSMMSGLDGDDDDMNNSPNLLMCLEGHVCSMTDLKFSNAGDRIMSGSADDGQVRIWAFNENFTANGQIIREYMKDEENNNSSDGFGGLGIVWYENPRR